VNPRPDNETLKRLYAEYHQRNGKDVNDWAKLMGKNFKEVLLFLNKKVWKCRAFGPRRLLMSWLQNIFGAR